MYLFMLADFSDDILCLSALYIVFVLWYKILNEGGKVELIVHSNISKER